MKHRSIRLASCLLTAACLAAGCTSTPDAAEAPAPAPPPMHDATWTPGAMARVVTIERVAVFTVIEADRDLFVVQTEGDTDGQDHATITWVISTPRAEQGPGRYEFARVSSDLGNSGATASAGDNWEAPGWTAPPGQAVGWAIIDHAALARTTRPITGEIEIVGLDTDEAGITLRIQAPGVAETMVFEGACRRVDRPHPVASVPIETRSGVPHRPKDEEEPKKTEAVWPWNDVFHEPSTFYRST